MRRRGHVHNALGPCQARVSGRRSSDIGEVTCMNCLTKELKSLTEHVSDLHSQWIDAKGEAAQLEERINQIDEERNPRGPS